MQSHDAEIAVIGAGIVGIATAYYLGVHYGRRNVALIEAGQPMALTSAHSGENYRNWWPHPVMTAFTDHGIGLMETIARETDNRIHMRRRGYALATRTENPRQLIDQLHAGYGPGGAAEIRVHDGSGSGTYQPALSPDWQAAPQGVDVLLDRALIRRSFPSFAPDVAAVLHIRRAGDIASQQLAQHMLEAIRAAGGRLVRGEVVDIERGRRFRLALVAPDGRATVAADAVVNAAGPYAARIGRMLGEDLPIATTLQQKIAFPDHLGVVPRGLPFAIDLDGQSLDWTGDERAALAEDPALAWLLAPMTGGIHCRPDGGDGGKWIKLGWAYNVTPEPPVAAPRFDPHFPEIVLRGASRLNPALQAYYGRLPRERVHYGGYYPMTAENYRGGSSNPSGCEGTSGRGCPASCSGSAGC